MKKEIILTSSGKLGDMIYCLPVASWLARDRGVKIHWVLPSSFPPFNFIAPLLLLQSFTSRVTLVPFQLKNLECGGQPYRFNPADFGIEGDYINLGFRHSPDKFITEFYAEEHGLGYDPSYRLEVWGDATPFRTSEVLKTNEGAMKQFGPQNATIMPRLVDLLGLARRMAAAQEVHSWYCGIAVLCWFAGIKCDVYREAGHASNALYFPTDRSLTFHSVVRK